MACLLYQWQRRHEVVTKGKKVRSCNPISARILLMCIRVLTHSLVAYISASAELRAVILWHFEIQCMDPLSHTKKPEMEQDLKRS
eukprot:2176638-Ditylum_brightwellii.AAC.1